MVSPSELAQLAGYAEVLGLRRLMGKNGSVLQEPSMDSILETLEDLRDLRKANLEARLALEGLKRLKPDKVDPLV